MLQEFQSVLKECKKAKTQKPSELNLGDRVAIAVAAFSG